MILFYDTETTGLPDWRAPSDAEHQPHLVQLAMVLTEDDGIERSCANVTIAAENWNIPDEVAAIHGITTNKSLIIGIREKLAVRLFEHFFSSASLLVAHNQKFDERIMRIARLRYGATKEEIQKNARPTACTMTAATPLVNLPPTDKMLAAGFAKPKPPKLAECIRHFFGEDLAGAHDAMVDVRACMKLYFHLRGLGVTP